MSIKEDILQEIDYPGTREELLRLLNKLDALEQDALRYRAFKGILDVHLCSDCPAYEPCLTTLRGFRCWNGRVDLQEEQLDKIVAHYKEKGLL